MVELEKYVKDLSLEQNPLSVLPDKWHVRFQAKEQACRPAGYTNEEVCHGHYSLLDFPWICATRQVQRVGSVLAVCEA